MQEDFQMTDFNHQGIRKQSFLTFVSNFAQAHVSKNEKCRKDLILNGCVTHSIKELDFYVLLKEFLKVICEVKILKNLLTTL